MSGLRSLAVAALLALPWASMSHAQSLSAADVGAFTGADRSERLIAGAREEGSLTLYSSLPVHIMNAIIAGFREAYDIRVIVWRAGSEEILQRSVIEARAGHHAVDIVETAAAEVEAISREGLLEEIRSPAFAELMPGSAVPGRPWISSRLIVFVTVYNTNLVSRDEAPTTLQDFLDPRWRGRLTVEANDFNWLMGISNVMGEDEAVNLFRGIVAANGISVRDGHGLITNMLASGEVQLTFTNYYEQAVLAKDQGAPVEVAFLDPVIAVPTGISVLRNAPHPHAAMLFVDFYLTEGQRILAEYDYIPSNLNYQNLPDGMDLSIADMSQFLDEYEKWRDLYRDIFAAQRR